MVNTADHEVLHREILDVGGTIAGGYVREWVRAGGETPPNEGWSDLDCFFPTHDKALAVTKRLKELLGDRCPNIHALFGLASFDDFFCNCWKFDGIISPYPPAINRHEQTLEETRQGIAHVIISIPSVMRKSRRVVALSQRGWEIKNQLGRTAIRPYQFSKEDWASGNFRELAWNPWCVLTEDKRILQIIPPPQDQPQALALLG
jgi:hypothetical protein